MQILRHLLPALALLPPTAAQTPLWSHSGFATSDDFGTGVATIPDTDGDGRDEVLVGDVDAAPMLFAPGQAFVLSGLDASVLHAYDGSTPTEGIGSSVAGLGDLDGDGRGDFAVSAAESPARVHSGANGALLRVLDPGPLGDASGNQAVALAPDVDGDGYAEVLVGAPGWSSTGAGRAYLFSGAWIVTGSGTRVLHVLASQDDGSHHGASVATCGDVDGDGLGDLVVGAPHEEWTSGATTYYGALRIYSSATGALLRLARGPTHDAWFGWSVAGLEDVDGDGVADVAVGAPLDDAAGEDAGSVQIISGADGTPAARADGGDSHDWFGWSLAAVGDVSGDGCPDLLAGARFDEGGGSARLFSACGAGALAHLSEPSVVGYGSSVGGGGDLDGDGRGDLVVGASASGRIFAYSGACLGAIERYCVAAPNSASAAGASIAATGSTSIAQDELQLIARSCPPQQSGVFYYGSTPIQAPVGDGFRCAAGLTFRLHPPTPIDATGIATRALDFTEPPASAGAGQILAGSTWYFQFWFRDPAGPGGTGFNYTDGLELVFCP